ncbi:MAG TPA: phosphatidate cytidylyltransferase [Candidatus Eisenbacteria bacterium]|nr:phosphatidate cytidylyltransferase [Candidatus Eisenbacteria bacterium]
MTSSTEAGVSVAPIEGNTAVSDARDASLPARIVSAVVFLPLLVLMARVGGIVYLVFTLFVVGLGLREFYLLLEAKGLSPHWKSGMFAGLLLPIAAYLRARTHRFEEWHGDAFLTVLIGAVLLAELRRGAGRQAVANSAATFLGVLYIGWLGTHLDSLRELPLAFGRPYIEGMSFALLPFFLTWICDTAAFAFGRAFGRIRLMPSISPQKSVEGATAGLLMAVAAGFGARAWFAPYLTPLDAVLLGVLVGVFGQLGDLVESLLKRDVETKDSSRLIPGHGGVLDRFDSVLFTAPIVYYYLIFRVLGG